MNQGLAKKTRREMRRYFRCAGLAPEALAGRFRLQVRPCPWWMPSDVWAALARWVLRPPTTGVAAPDQAAPG